MARNTGIGTRVGGPPAPPWRWWNRFPWWPYKPDRPFGLAKVRGGRFRGVRRER